MATAKVVRVEDVLEGPQDVDTTSQMQLLVSGGADGERKSTTESSLQGLCHVTHAPGFHWDSVFFMTLFDSL